MVNNRDKLQPSFSSPIYEVRPLHSDIADSPPLFSSSINTSASTLEEVKLAERQMFQQTCPETFDTIQSVYDAGPNRQYHFKKLKQMMSYYEKSNSITNNHNDSSNIYLDHLQDPHNTNHEQQESANTLPHGPIIDPPPRHSSRNHYRNASPNLKRYDSSKIVRYTRSFRTPKAPILAIIRD